MCASGIDDGLSVQIAVSLLELDTHRCPADPMFVEMSQWKSIVDAGIDQDLVRFFPAPDAERPDMPQALRVDVDDWSGHFVGRARPRRLPGLFIVSSSRECKARDHRRGKKSSKSHRSDLH